MVVVVDLEGRISVTDWMREEAGVVGSGAVWEEEEVEDDERRFGVVVVEGRGPRLSRERAAAPVGSTGCCCCCGAGGHTLPVHWRASGGRTREGGCG